MSKEALKLALEALDHNLLFTSLMPGYDGRVIEKAYKEINKVLAEQPAQQEPYEIDWPQYNEHAMGCGLEDRDEHCRYGAMRYGWDSAVEAVAQAIPDVIYTSPQPAPVQQEPVAVVSGYYGGHCVILPIDPERIFNSNTALYTSPPAQRKPLTDEEIDALREKHSEGRGAGWRFNFKGFARAIEAKLKEKNT